MIELAHVSKTVTLHNQGRAVIEVIRDASLAVARGECVALTGASGAGKSTLMRMIYGNYTTQAGAIRIGHVEIVQAVPREIIALRREVLGHVSQFLCVVPRVTTLDVVAEPLRATGVPAAAAEARARALLARLNIPERLWALSPTTFSGGEQQRVNIARGFARGYPAMLLDEPSASLDAARPAMHLVRRVITRAPERGGEAHDAVTRDAFAAMVAAGAFALHWEAHGLRYGIPAAVTRQLDAGTECLVNLSRGALADAAAVFPRCLVLNITAGEGTIARRLAARGRETRGEIAGRLARAQRPLPEGLEVVHISNAGPLPETVARATAFLSSAQRSTQGRAPATRGKAPP